MIGSSNSSIIYISSGVLLASFLLATWITLIVSIDNPYRSVEKCTNQSQIVSQLWIPVNCRLHCERTYIFTSFETKRMNRRVFHHQVNHLAGGRAFECCCRFNFAWPKFVQPSAVDRVHNEPQKVTKPYDCLPLGPIKIGLSPRTIDAYERVCDYMDKKEPLTMLEAVDFANLTSYLNMMQPKNPMIMRTIKHKPMRLLTKEVYARLEESINDKDKIFLNSLKPLDEFEGYKLAASTVRKIGNLLRFHLADAMKNGIIAKAVDEYVLSYAVIDVSAASKKVDELNRNLAIPGHLLRGDYDQYDEDSERLAFTMGPTFDCKTLDQTQNRLANYLSAMSASLSSLSTKLTYDHTGQVNGNLKYLLRSQKIYKLLEKVNCKRTPRRVPIKKRP